MSTITTDTTQGLVNAILAHLPNHPAPAHYRVTLDEDKIEIDFVSSKGAAAKTAPSTPDERREHMRERLRKRAVAGVGLSDWAVSREAFYSEDN